MRIVTRRSGPTSTIVQELCLQHKSRPVSRRIATIGSKRHLDHTAVCLHLTMASRLMNFVPGIQYLGTMEQIAAPAASGQMSTTA